MNARAGIRAITLTAAVAAACGEPAPEVDVVASGVAPAGSDAVYVSDNLPLLMNPGERLNVRMTMRNTGAASPANDWNGSYQLRRNPNTASPFGFVNDLVTGTVPAQPNTDEDFDFIVTAPAAPGTYSFNTRMYSALAGQAGYFGSAVSIPNVVVDAGQTRRWACSFEAGLSTLPANMLATEARVVTVVVRNTGTGTWVAAGSPTCLRSRDDTGPLANLYFWGPNICPTLTADVLPGDTFSFSFEIRAPATPGTYPFLRQMFQSGQPTPTGGVGYFDLVNHCVNTNITVQPSPPFLDSAIASQDFPALLAPLEPRLVRVSMQNTGVESWVGADYALTSQTTPPSLMGATIAYSDADVANGASGNFVLVVRGPAAPGNYAHQWQMSKLVAPGAGDFGAMIDVPVNVDGANTPFYTAGFVGQTIPARVTAGSTVSFSITMQNTGSGPWDHEYFQLRSRSTPNTLWGTVADALLPAETVAIGGQRTFTFDVVAPAAAGTYESRWGMALAAGPGYFFLDSTDAVAMVDVTLCGNGTLDAGESCDDGNLINGDGCDDTCGGVVIDLATDAAGRTLIGSNTLKQLGNVAIGDISGDGTNDVIVGEMSNVYPPGEVGRGRAGIVYGFGGGAGFLSGAPERVPSTATLQIWGADELDRLGGSDRAGILVADVTGDGTNDLIVSSNFADGDGNTRTDCGETFVFIGGAGLLGAGTIDLAATPPSALIGARIIGATAGAGLIALAAGDLTGDGVADLVLGSPNDDTGGADAGLVTVVAGGAALASGAIVDLALGGGVATVVGAAAGDQLGRTAAVGNLGGTADNDLVVGATFFDNGALLSAGAVWALFGPLAGASNLGAGGFDVRIMGGDNHRYGAMVAVANVTGGADNELIVGAPQTRNGANVQTGSVDVWTGPFAGGAAADLASGDLPDSRFSAPDFADNTGRSLAVGDMNNDGYGDIAVVMSAADGPANGRTNCGELMVVRGAASLPAVQELGANPGALTVIGETDLDYLGNHPNSTALGDIDGDGRADLCVGEPNGGGDLTIAAPGRIDCFSSPL